MSARTKICAVTSSRADYGLLRPLLLRLKENPRFDLHLIVTGGHLVRSQGHTRAEVETDGFASIHQVDLKQCDESPTSLSEAVAIGMTGISEILSRVDPDAVVLLGDRWEMLAVAVTTTLHKKILVHLCGGDVTEGAWDDAIRHSISKLAHLHFVTNNPARERLLRMGEQPARVFNVGSTVFDNLTELKLLDRSALESELKVSVGAQNFLITFQPETQSSHSLQTLRALLQCLSSDFPEATLFFTGANADPEGQQINSEIERFVSNRPNSYLFKSLGAKKYLSLMRYADVVIGNSSSGIIEAPASGVPTVNIGDRQKGRVMAASVFQSAPDHASLKQAILSALSWKRAPVSHPYGSPGASAAMVKILESQSDWPSLYKKTFFDGKAP